VEGFVYGLTVVLYPSRLLDSALTARRSDTVLRSVVLSVAEGDDGCNAEWP
jgi:hypothetical protein